VPVAPGAPLDGGARPAEYRVEVADARDALLEVLAVEQQQRRHGVPAVVIGGDAVPLLREVVNDPEPLRVAIW
jgi:hypothetical protein